VLPIRVPPLRERLQDIEALAEALSEDIARRSGMPQRLLSTSALDWLARQPWPGNIRELRNALEQASLMSDELVLCEASFAPAGSAAATLPLPAPAAVAQPPALEAGPLRPLAERVAEVEREAIAQALSLTDGNRLAAARLLQISRASLYDRLTRWPELLGPGGLTV